MHDLQIPWESIVQLKHRSINSSSPSISTYINAIIPTGTTEMNIIQGDDERIAAINGNVDKKN